VVLAALAPPGEAPVSSWAGEPPPGSPCPNFNQNRVTALPVSRSTPGTLLAPRGDENPYLPPCTAPEGTPSS